MVGAPGIEPGPYAPKAYILPLYYAPFDKCCSLSLSYYNEIVDKVNPAAKSASVVQWIEQETSNLLI